MGLARSFARRGFKRLLNATATKRALAAIAAGYVWLVYNTTRWRWVGREHLEEMLAAPSFIAGVWHSRLLPIAMLRPRGRRAVALASSNRDGDLIARVVVNLGADVVYGSSRDPKKPEKDRGGADAMPKLVAALRDGAIVVITPDGPRGPRMRAKVGAAIMSAQSGAPVLPVAFSVRRARMFKSWDRFLLPWPFNRGVMVFGPPIAPSASQEPEALEAKRQEIEAAIQLATERADAEIGRATPEPEAPFVEAPA